MVFYNVDLGHYTKTQISDFTAAIFHIYVIYNGTVTIS